MSRTTLLVLVALGATLAGFALSSNARRAEESSREPRETASAAGPQKTRLGWREEHGTEEEEKLVFSVDSLEIRPHGWKARIALENASSGPFEVGGPSASSGYTFGLVLMDTNDQAELDRQAQEGTLPAVRRAVQFDPPLPPVLEPGDSWRGAMSAPGALVALSWVRVVFGPLVSVGSPPEGLQSDVVWITDSAYRLRP